MNPDNDFFFLFHSSKIDNDFSKSYYFENPIDIVECYSFNDIPDTLLRIEELTKTYYLAGFFAYETGYFFDETFKNNCLEKSKFPLIYFGIFDRINVFDENNSFITKDDYSISNPKRNISKDDYSISNPKLNISKEDYSISNPKRNISKDDYSISNPKLKITKDDFSITNPKLNISKDDYSISNPKLKITKDDYSIFNLKLNISKENYIHNIKKIQDYLRAGHTYQVNYTIKYNFNFHGNHFSFYKNLLNNQNVDFSAFIKFKNSYIISLSPELFFKKNNNKIILKPMKGTAKRGKTIFEDELIKENLLRNEKEKAENLMIVDLIRNDVGKISKIGSVNVSKMFEIQKYNTLFQMISTVSSELKDDMNISHIIKSLFPCGSVTGAPKIRTMEIIRELEQHNRNIYCGALGFFLKQEEAVFNVPIRTIYIDENNFAEMGIGSGITIDSVPENEFNECILKGKFLTKKFVNFDLIETILFAQDYYLLNLHLIRLKYSSQYFDYKFSDEKIISALNNNKQKLDFKKSYKVRLLLSKNGNIKIENTIINCYNVNTEKIDNTNHSFQKMFLEDFMPTKKIIISKHKVNSNDVFLYHKTTNRKFYNDMLKYAVENNCYDTIFFNEKNELTEGTFNNIIIKMKSKFFTPALSSGLLNGVYRQHLIDNNVLEEKVLYLHDLRNAESIYLCNSVRKLIKVRL